MYVHLLLKKKKKKKRGTRRKENHASHRHPQLSRSCTSHDRVRENTDSDGVVRHPAGSGGIERGVEGRRIDVLVTNQRQNQKYVPAVPRSNYGKLAGVKRRGGGEQAAGTYIEDGVSVAEVGREGGGAKHKLRWGGLIMRRGQAIITRAIVTGRPCSRGC